MLQTFLSSMSALCSPLSCCRPSETGELMPAIHIMSYQDPRAFLDAVGPWLRVERLASNTILPYAEMALSSQNEGQAAQHSNLDLLWIVCWSLSTPDPSPIEDPTDPAPGGNSVVIPFTSTPQLRLIVQAGGFPLGRAGGGGMADASPLCIFAPNMLGTPTMGEQPLVDAMRATAARLAQLRSPSRINSLFGPAPLVDAFSLVWDALGTDTARSSVQRRFKLLQFSPPSASDARKLESMAPGGMVAARQATEHDMSRLTSLYHEFYSATHSWNQTRAQDHLSTLVKASNVWLFENQEGSDTDGVVAFCEVGRRGQSLAAITALYTIPGLRRHGFGSHVLSGVLQSLFASGITSVVAYAPADTLPSECVFRKAGFTATDDTEWLEVGYAA